MTKYISLESKEVNQIKKTMFTAYFNQPCGWTTSKLNTEDFDKVVYLGKCAEDGDMFACYRAGTINIYKGIKGDEF